MVSNQMVIDGCTLRGRKRPEPNRVRESMIYSLKNHGTVGTTDTALLTAILGSTPRDEQHARKLLEAYDYSLFRIGQADVSELIRRGLSERQAVSLRSAIELTVRMKCPDFSKRTKIQGPEDVAAMYIPQLRHLMKEQFHILALSTANQVIRKHLVSEGNLNSSIVHPREVYRIAIIESAAAIIGLHNHPSGNPTPSKEDIAITKQLVESGRIIGIPFHDHIVIAGEEYVSLAQKGYV